jgi:replicative DNA helicase
MVGVTRQNKNQDPREIHERLLLARKQRNGPTGYVHATFDPVHVRYTNIRSPEKG